MRRSQRQGFTLFEMMIVVAIVGVLAAIVSTTLNRQREKQDISAELKALRAAIERTRAMAVLGGSRIGTDRVNYLATCPAPPVLAAFPAPQNNLLWMVIDPAAGTWTFPNAVNYNPATDQVDVDCRTETLGTAYRASARTFFGQFAAPAATVAIAFTATGRLVAPGQPNNSLFVQLQHSTAPGGATYGFRVLTSGITCPSSDPGGLVEPCEQDRG